MYVVILAGGGGTRLWPLSRPELPKPFLPLLGDSSLIQHTATRVEPLVDAASIYVVTEERLTDLVRAQLPQLPPGNVIGEPIGRNTAPAIALAVAAIDRPDDEVMLVLPADHEIVDEAGFRAALATAAQVASGTAGIGAQAGEDRPLVTLGIEPAGPETGYGYIVAEAGDGTAVGRRVARFVEKPPAEVARELLETGLASWNAGIFAWTRGTIRDALRRSSPATFAPLEALFAAAPAGELPDHASLARAYAAIHPISIDYAVLEQASVEGRVRVVPVAVGWSDVGSWTAFRDVLRERARDEGIDDAVVGSGPRRDIGSEGTLVVSKGRLVVTIGLRDVIVIETPEAVLVCAADRAQDVRRVAEEVAAAAARELIESEAEHQEEKA